MSVRHVLLRLWACGLFLHASAIAGQLPDPKAPPRDPPGTGALSTPNDAHIKGRVPERLTPPGKYDHLPVIDESHWIVLAERERPMSQAGTFDPVLSNACQRGQFVTTRTNRLVIRYVGAKDVGEDSGVVQVVSPIYRPTLLYDPDKLARGDETYLFYSNDEPNCRVWIEGNAKPRRLDPVRGTAVPKPDPHALKKREAEIKARHPAPARGGQTPAQAQPR